MIDRGTWNNEWALLCERFRMTGDREPTKLMRDRYYEYLSPRLETAQFLEASARIYAESEFFPKPLDFVPEAAAGRSAIGEWEKVLPLLRNSASPLDRLDESAQRAVRAMGGLASIGRDESALPFRRNEFVELYEGFASSMPKALPSAVPANILAHADTRQ